MSLCRLFSSHRTLPRPVIGSTDPSTPSTVLPPLHTLPCPRCERSSASRMGWLPRRQRPVQRRRQAPLWARATPLPTLMPAAQATAVLSRQRCGCSPLAGHWLESGRCQAEQRRAMAAGCHFAVGSSPHVRLPCHPCTAQPACHRADSDLPSAPAPVEGAHQQRALTPAGTQPGRRRLHACGRGRGRTRGACPAAQAAKDLLRHAHTLADCAGGCCSKGGAWGAGGLGRTAHAAQRHLHGMPG